MIKLKPKKNIIMFSIDYRRIDLYEAFGGIYPTPNISKLAKRGILFNKMYSPSASTVMSLSSVINGKYPHEFKRFRYPEVNPQYFRNNIFYKMKKNGYKNYIIYPENFINNWGLGIYMGNDAEKVVIPEYLASDIAVKYLIKLIKKASQPYFIFFHNVAPEKRGVDPNNVHPMERYVKEDDRAIGEILRNVNFNDTTVVFYSDHGFLNGEHGHLFSHAFFLYEQNVRVPCIITSDKTAVCNDAYSLTQLYDLLLKNEISPPRSIYADTQYKIQPHRVTMVVDDNWKYLAHYSPYTAITGKQEELYDLKSDPLENRNLLNDISRHPLQFIHNIKNVSVSGFDVFRYEQKYIDKKANHLRNKISKIWLKDFKDVLGYINHKSPNKLVNKIKLMKNFDQLAFISHFMCSLKRPKCWYGSKDGISKNIPFEEYPQPPFNYPGLPINFKKHNNDSFPYKLL
ncbi:MAG: sulfatase-like hydrolase/transferase [Candidatus Aureabacteria bacterium]|nr:sulfatase-like hydrolase/transferase [Candidatus Auribacterota bacterium]